MSGEYGAFTVTAESSEDLQEVSYSDSVLSFGTGAAGKSYTIQQTAGVGESTGDCIVVNGGTTEDPVTITLNGVNVQPSNCAMDVQGSSAVNLVLGDGSKNTLRGAYFNTGLNVAGAASITIKGNGILKAAGGGHRYGIGGGGNITINEGTITATGGFFASGIGGGNITISGGTVTATGGGSAAGIGGCQYGGAGDITISGGTVTATGGINGAGIGGAKISYGGAGNITISGGTVTAIGSNKSAGIGGGETSNVGAITISGGMVTAIGDSSGIGGGASSSAAAIKINQTATVIAASNGTKNALDVSDVSEAEGGTVANIIQANFESALANGTTVEVKDDQNMSFTTPLAYQTTSGSIKSIAFASPDLKSDLLYTLFKTQNDGVEKKLQNGPTGNDTVLFEIRKDGINNYSSVQDSTKGLLIVGTEITEYDEDTFVTLKAADAPDGKVFAEWMASGITLTNPENQEITFAMPANVVELTPTYVDKIYAISSAVSNLEFCYNTGNTTVQSKEIPITNTGNCEATCLCGALTNFTITNPTDGNTIAAGESKAWTITPNSGLASGTYEENFTISTGHDTSVSIPLKLVVNEALNVSVNPASNTIIQGNSQTLTASAAGGSGSYTYQWYDGSEEIAGSTGNTLTVTPEDVATYTYKVAVNDGIETKEASSAITVRKAKLLSITTPDAITGVANGTAKTASALGLPKTVTIATEDSTVTKANVSWDLTNLAEGTYDPSNLKAQTFKVNGTVTLPDAIDADTVELATTIQVTVDEAPVVEDVTADPAAGTYTENKKVSLTTTTDGAEIYYTTNGDDPSKEDATEKVVYLVLHGAK